MRRGRWRRGRQEVEEEKGEWEGRREEVKVGMRRRGGLRRKGRHEVEEGKGGRRRRRMIRTRRGGIGGG